MSALGRGFGDLIPTDSSYFDFDPTAEEDGKISKLHNLKISEIIPDENQPRRHFNQEQLEALASSIREHGVLQPIVVTKEDKVYKIVAGERRWRASQLAGLTEIPAIVRTLDAQNRLELSLIENVQREDLNAIETATAYAKLRDQFNLTNAQIAERVGKSQSAIINTMRLLALPDEAKHAMIEHKLSEGQMRPLITATPEQIAQVLPKIINENWSARRVEQFMVDQKNQINQSHVAREAVVAPRDTTERVDAISHRLGIKVKLHTSSRGSGDIVLKFKNKEEFEKICSILTA